VTELIKFLSLTGPWVPFAIGFVGLPVLYMLLALDVHKDFSDSKTLQDMNLHSGTHMPDIQALLHVFNLEWWVILAIGIMLAGVLNLPELASISKHFSAACPSTDQLVQLGNLQVCPANAVEPATVGGCRMARGILLLFGIGVSLGLAFFFGWSRVSTARAVAKLKIEAAKQ
jgi:hypothetical protein